MNTLLNSINDSKFLVGISILLTNVGARYVMLDFSKTEDKFLQKPLVRRFIVFCIAFMATRDVLMSIIITLLFIILIKRGQLYKDMEVDE